MQLSLSVVKIRRIQVALRAQATIERDSNEQEADYLIKILNELEDQISLFGIQEVLNEQNKT